MHVCIVGLGLMGGSLALALKAAAWCTSITGVSRRPETLAAAAAAGAIDRGLTDLGQGVKDADLVVLATPVRTILAQLVTVGEHARAGSVVLDLGSTKGEICRQMDRLPPHVQPLGGHPMCGREVGGFAAAQADLYEGKTFVLCPLPRTAASALAVAREMAEAAGSSVRLLSPEEHDRAVAAISHLPYLVAAALVSTVEDGGSPLAWELAASGFRDTTRVAASDVGMMLDIVMTNRHAILDWLGRYGRQLDELAAALETGDEARLRALLSAVQDRRSNLRL
jgi:prephenate dehydrogenase